MDQENKKDVVEIYTLIIKGSAIKEPLMYSLATKMKVVPNLLKGRITKEVAKIELSLRGTKANIIRAVKYLNELGIETKPKK